MGMKKLKNQSLRCLIDLIIISLGICIVCNVAIAKDNSNETIMLDTSKLNKEIEKVNEVILEENEDQIINVITFCDFNSGTDKLLIIDGASGLAYQYNNLNGKFIRSFKMPASIADSVAKSGKLDIRIMNLGWMPIPSENYKLFNINMDNSPMKPFFSMGKFEGDEIILTGTTYFPIVSSLGDVTLLNYALLFLCDSNFNIKRLIIPEMNERVFPLNYQFSILPDKLLLMTVEPIYDEFGKNRFDSLEALSLYDINGMYLSPAAYIPEIYTKNYLRMNTLWIPYFDVIVDIPFIGFPYCDTIYSINNKPLFKLKNLPFNNNYGFESYREKAEPYFNDFKTSYLTTDSGMVYMQKQVQMQMDKEKQINITNEALDKLMHISISGIFRINNNIMVWLRIKDKDAEMGYYYFLQEYKSDGTLVKYLKIEDNDKEKLQYVTYDNSSDKLVMFKKTKKNIVMENYKWE
jgi:hypothetical protein